MPITPADIYLFQSQVVADTPDGGGPMTGVEIIDGQLNNLFDDSSRTDRVNGRVSLRKAFGAVRTNTREKYLGAHAIVTHPPADGRVTATLLDLDDYQSRRDMAKAFVESYLVASVETQMILFSSQPQGARTIVAYQNLSDVRPGISDVLCLSIEQLGHAQFGFQQFVRITSLSERIIRIGSNGPQKTELVMGISEALELTFPGSDLADFLTNAQKPTRVRKADLRPDARFYGVSPITAPITEGATMVYAQRVLQAIVPAGFAESPLLDQQIAATGDPLTATGEAITESFTRTPTGGALSLQLLRPSLPGSVRVTADASAADNDVSLVEAAGGLLTREAGSGSPRRASPAAWCQWPGR